MSIVFVQVSNMCIYSFVPFVSGVVSNNPVTSFSALKSNYISSRLVHIPTSTALKQYGNRINTIILTAILSSIFNNGSRF